ncbi:MAG: LLM class F420-dependent oxidoreductase [Porticoccaceae bacterium]
MLRLGLMLAYDGKRVEMPLALVHRAEALGFDSVWVSEAYGSDAVTSATWLLARTERIRVGTCVMQIPARTPALAAMTAMSLHQLSGGRFIAGLGASGPQVVEGWHGVPYGKPVTRFREYTTIMRRIMAREAPVTFDGEIYHLPATGPGATGLGKPLKSILGAAPDIPIYSAAITPAGLAAAAEFADGVFPIWQSPERFGVLAESLDKGLARSGRTLADFDVAPLVRVVMGDDLATCRLRIKEQLALYIGGMGARDKNFYNDYTGRLGFGQAARAIQDHFLAGDKAAAAAAVPDELVDEISLVGPERRIRQRAQAWRDAGRRGEVTTLIIATDQPEVLPLLADCLL